MSRTARFTAPLALALAVPCAAQAITRGAHEVERLSSGLNLLTVSGALADGTSGGAYLVEPDGELVHVWPVDTRYTHTAERVNGWNVLLTDYGNGRVIEVEPDGTVVWDTDLLTFSDGSTLVWPNDVKPLAGGNVLISDVGTWRVIELRRNGQIAWSFGQFGVPSLLRQPHNPERHADGNTIVCDSGNDRVREVAPDGTVVWDYAPTGATKIFEPRDADQMPDGRYLIVDHLNPAGGRLAIVDKVLGEVGSIPVPSWATRPYDADFQPATGTYLVGGGDVYELDAAGNVVWQYPTGRLVNPQPITVFNASSNVFVRGTLYVPSDATAASPAPTIVFVPGGTGDATAVDRQATELASLGFVTATFDPDGRGRSTGGGAFTSEDWCGTIQQDGLHQVLRWVVSHPSVDPGALVVASYDLGTTMAAGCLARYPNDPPVALLRDWEGQASRNETAAAFGGPIAHDPLDDTWWSEREAVAFLPLVQAAYLREQTAVDHDPALHPTNFHALDMLAAATRASLGGGGVAPWTQMNAPFWNESDTVFDALAPPRWVDESIDDPLWDGTLLQLEVSAFLRMPRVTVGGDLVPGGRVDAAVASRASWTGKPVRVELFGAPPPAAPLAVVAGALDASGAAVLAWNVPNDPAFVDATLWARAVVDVVEHPYPDVAGPRVEFELDATLSASVASLSLAAGGSQALTLAAGTARAGDAYVVLGSASGTSPATPLGALLVPLVADSYTSITLNMANTPPFVATLSLFDASGGAAAAIALPPGTDPSLAGLALDHAYVAFDLASGAPTLASNAVGLALTP